MKSIFLTTVFFTEKIFQFIYVQIVNEWFSRIIQYYNIINLI